MKFLKYIFLFHSISVSGFKYTEGESPYEIKIDFEPEIKPEVKFEFENIDSFFIQNGEKYSFKNGNLELFRSRSNDVTMSFTRFYFDLDKVHLVPFPVQIN